MDFALFNVKSTLFDAVIVCGGAKSAADMSKKGDVLGFIMEAFKHFKVVGAVGDGIHVLSKCVLPNGMNPILLLLLSYAYIYCH